MKQKMRRAMGAGICVMLGAMVISGCGKHAENDGKTEEGKTIVRLMSGGAGYWEEHLEPVVEAYNESQDEIKVVVDYFQYDALLSNNKLPRSKLRGIRPVSD